RLDRQPKPIAYHIVATPHETENTNRLVETGRNRQREFRVRFGMYRRIETVLDRNPRRSKAVVDQRVDEVSGLNIEQPSALERLLYQRGLFGRTRRAIIRRGLEEPHVGTRHRNRQDLLDHLIAIPYREQELD